MAATQNEKAKGNQVHLVLQGKGGVGKSLISAILGQYFQHRKAAPHCFDTDPVNATFAQYQALRAEHINVLRRGAIHDKRFDELFEKICALDGVCIVDTGATTFVPLWNYILENDILNFLTGRSRRVFVHCVVTGGQAMEDTLNGFNRLAETTTQKNVIVWLNEYFGEISRDGKSFDEFRVAEEQAAKLLGTVVIRERNPNTYGDDMRQMLSKRLTFEEAIRLAEFSLVSKQRLTIIRRELFEQLDRIEME
jgi:CobQ/CobB/MinD/ParA nucleotide binding domain